MISLRQNSRWKAITLYGSIKEDNKGTGGRDPHEEKKFGDVKFTSGSLYHKACAGKHLVGEIFVGQCKD